MWGVSPTIAATSLTVNMGDTSKSTGSRCRSEADPRSVLDLASQQEAETPEDLRLRPPVHRHGIPPELQLAGPERAIALAPAVEEVLDRSRDDGVEIGEAAPQHRGDVDALGVVVQLAPVDRETRRPRERFGQLVGVEKIRDVVAHAALDGLG